MHQIERAIIMAAGTGKRARPLTYSVTKPLIRVNGQPILESAISALKQNGITEIYIVVGYLKVLFTGYVTEWMEKYDVSIELVENPYYEYTNNISSFYVARDFFENAMILEGDLIIRDPDILSPSFSVTDYCAYYVENDLIDWMAEIDSEDRIIRCVYPGDKPSGWQLRGISRWTPADGNRFKTLLEESFLNKDYGIHGDDVALIKHHDDFEIYIRRISCNAITEIDDFAAFQEIDENYRLEP